MEMCEAVFLLMMNAESFYSSVKQYGCNHQLCAYSRIRVDPV